MCARYFLEESPELRPFVEAMNRASLTEAFRGKGKETATGEIRPTDVAPAIACSRGGKETVFPMQWGFTGKTLLINARAETAAEKPAFREAWASHRCVLPATRYFEWEHGTDEKGRKKTGDKYGLHPRGDAVTWLCGLYRMEEGLPHFVVLTREAGEGIRFLHDRMPLMLPETLIREWIRPENRPEDLLEAALTEIAYEKAV